MESIDSELPDQVGEPDRASFQYRAMELAHQQGNLIRDARKKLGLSIEELANRTGLHTNTIGRIERGLADCSTEQLLVIAHHLKTAPVELSHFAPELRRKGIEDDEFVLIDMVDTRLGGENFNGDRSEVIGRFAFKRGWLASRGLKPETSRLVRHSGKAMADKINHGDVLLVNMAVKTMGKEGIYVIQLDGVDDVKLLQRDYANGGLFIISFNKEYQTIVLSSEQAERLRINGKVAWHAEEL